MEKKSSQRKLVRTTTATEIGLSSIFHRGTRKKKSSIICTLGPTSSTVEVMEKMLNEGMDVARFNFSHGDHTDHQKFLDNLRQACSNTGRNCAVMLDTKGPEIRTGLLENQQPVDIPKGHQFIFTTDYSILGNKDKIACSYNKLPTVVKKGGIVLLADGSLTCKVLEIYENSIKVEAMNTAQIGERKNMNLPGAEVDLPVLLDKDKEDIVKWGIPNKIDAIAASFVRTKKDVQTIREVLGENAKEIKIISKIENQQGIDNFDEILAETDGVMVARGDLGMEIPIEKVFLCQKLMIKKCNEAGKPVITATQMLESMVHNPRPTRAEASDVANAVLDGTDCVMLSGETARGDFPLDCIKVMRKICLEAERCQEYDVFQTKNALYKTLSNWSTTEDQVASAAARAAEDQSLDLIIALTLSGNTARLLAKYRPRQMILAFSPNQRVVNQFNFSRGIDGFLVPEEFKEMDEIVKYAIDKAQLLKYCIPGHSVIVVHGASNSYSNILKIIRIS